MKRSLILALTLCVALVVTVSFTLIKRPTPVKKAHSKTAPAKKAVSNCTADMGTVTLVSISSSSFTVSWTHSGTPDHYNYGGYYNGSPFVAFPSGSTYSTTLTLPRPSSAYGFRIGIVCVCSDGTTVGSTHGILYDATTNTYSNF